MLVSRNLDVVVVAPYCRRQLVHGVQSMCYWRRTISVCRIALLQLGQSIFQAAGQSVQEGACAPSALIVGAKLALSRL